MFLNSLAIWHKTKDKRASIGLVWSNWGQTMRCKVLRLWRALSTFGVQSSDFASGPVMKTTNCCGKSNVTMRIWIHFRCKNYYRRMSPRKENGPPCMRLRLPCLQVRHNHSCNMLQLNAVRVQAGSKDKQAPVSSATHGPATSPMLSNGVPSVSTKWFGLFW